MRAARATRVPVPQGIAVVGALTEPDYASAFELSTPDASASTAEQWARATFEGAPAPLRWPILSGWRLALGLRLRPTTSATHVLGWSIAQSDAETILLQARSRLLTAQNIVLVSQSSVVWITLVRFKRAAARPLWAMAAPIHHLTIPDLLQGANLSRSRR